MFRLACFSEENEEKQAHFLEEKRGSFLEENKEKQAHFLKEKKGSVLIFQSENIKDKNKKDTTRFHYLIHNIKVSKCTWN